MWRRGSVLRTFLRDVESSDALAKRGGIPVTQQGRKVKIYIQPKLTTQGGFGQSKNIWKIAFQGEGSWENPLMGWASGRDTLAGQVNLKFSSKDQAIDYAKEHGNPTTCKLKRKKFTK